jgi:hypothetical protein
MKKLLALLLLFGIVGCGPSAEEKERIASVTCSIIKETKNFESSIRVEKMNEAREKIKLPPYLDGDEEIKRSINFNTCELLVKNDKSYLEKTNQLEKDYLEEVARFEAEQKAEKERIAAEQKAEKERIAAEQKIAEEKESERQIKEYTLNRKNIKAQAIKACENIKLTDAAILIIESRKYISNEDKKELKIKYLKSVAPNLPDEIAELAVGFGGYRQSITSLEVSGMSRLSAAKKRPIQCMDQVLPPTCEEIMEIPLSYKYFPKERSKKFLELSEGMTKCSELI